MTTWKEWVRVLALKMSAAADMEEDGWCRHQSKGSQRRRQWVKDDRHGWAIPMACVRKRRKKDKKEEGIMRESPSDKVVPASRLRAVGKGRL